MNIHYHIHKNYQDYEDILTIVVVGNEEIKNFGKWINDENGEMESEMYDLMKLINTNF